MKYIRDYGLLLGMAGSIIILDQWTKALVRNNLPIGGIWMPLDWLRPYARIVHWYNSGAAFGLFQDGGMVFAILALLVAGLILYYFPHIPSRDWTLRLALGLQLGGATGNLIDRLTMDWRVTDFISIGTFPVFNVADSSITIGVGVLLLGVWFKGRSEQAHAAAEFVPGTGLQAGPSPAVDEAQGE